MLVYWSWNMCLIVMERNQCLCLSGTALHTYRPLALSSSNDHYCSYICYSVIQICSFKIWLLASAPYKAPVTTACYTRMSSWSPIAPCLIQSIISRLDALVYWSDCLSQKNSGLVVCIWIESSVYGFDHLYSDGVSCLWSIFISDLHMPIRQWPEVLYVQPSEWVHIIVVNIVLDPISVWPSKWEVLVDSEFWSIISRLDPPVYSSDCLSQKIVVWLSVSGLNLLSTDLIICIQTEHPVYDQFLYQISTCL